MSTAINGVRKCFLVVRRIKPGMIGTLQPRLITNDYISASKVAAMYKGIEGEYWPGDQEQGILEKDPQDITFEEAYTYYKAVKKIQEREVIDLLCLEVGGKEEKEQSKIKNFTFYGYDYGIFLSPWNAYSIIFNEILFGNYNELRGVSKWLNKHLLLPSLEKVSELRYIREKLLSAGADLETSEDEDEIPAAIRVFGYSG